MRNRARPLNQLINGRTDEILLSKVAVADTVWRRFVGLMGRNYLPDEEGLFLSPCSSIHCFFMRFPIDVVFVDKNNTVVAIYPNKQPWSLAIPGKDAYAAIEAAASQLAPLVQVGDRLIFREEEHA